MIALILDYSQCALWANISATTRSLFEMQNLRPTSDLIRVCFFLFLSKISTRFRCSFVWRKYEIFNDFSRRSSPESVTLGGGQEGLTFSAADSALLPHLLISHHFCIVTPSDLKILIFFFCAALSSEPFKFLAETDRLHWLPNKHLLNVFHLPATGLGVRLREVEGARWRGYLGRGMKTWVRCYPPWKVHIVGQGSSTVIVWLYPLGSFKLPSAWVPPLGILT